MAKVTCGRKADLGYCNLWGSPYLKFTLRCNLNKGHAGKHQGIEKVSIKPTGEGGDPVKSDSIEAQPMLIKWEGE